MPTITLPDGSQRPYDQSVTAAAVAADIGPGLAKAALAAKVDGRLVDVSLLDGMIGLLGYLAQLAFFTGQDPQPQGSQHPNLVPYGQFPASDGAIIIACLTNAFWGRICRALDMPELADDPRFDSLEKRRSEREMVNGIVSGFTRRHTVKELEELLETTRDSGRPAVSSACTPHRPRWSTTRRAQARSVGHADD